MPEGPRQGALGAPKVAASLEAVTLSGPDVPAALAGSPDRPTERLAILERFFRSLKKEMLRRGRVPFRSDELRALLNSYIAWHCEHRPHQGLGGRTPDEVCFGVEPANEMPRMEPRALWPKCSACAAPRAPVKENRGRVVALVVRHHDDDARLPVVELRAAA